jgi:ankyrin repeat protein
MNIHTALLTHCESYIQNFLHSNSTVDVRDSSNQTPLHIAAGEGLHDIVVALVKKGANVQAVDNKKWTPLHCAANGSNYDICEYLIKHKANCTALTNDNTTALSHVVKGRSESEQQIRVIESLLQHGVSVNCHNDANETPLCRSCLVGSEGAVRYLLSKGADVNYATKFVQKIVVTQNFLQTSNIGKPFFLSTLVWE